MDKSTIIDLKEQRAGLIGQMRDLTLAAESESRDFTAEETQEFDRMEKETDSLEKRASRLEQMLGFQPAPTRQINADDDGPGDGDGDAAKAPKTLAEYREQRAGTRVQDTDEYRSAFYHWLSESDDRNIDAAEFRVLSKASAGAGLNLVPTDFQRELVDALRDYGVMRSISRIITTDNGDALQVPTVTSHGTAAWTAENAAYTASDDVFGQTTLNAYKAATIILVSEELLQDSAFDLQAYIKNEFALRIGVLANTGYVVGTGSTQPTGVTTQATAGTTAASATTITFDNLVDMYHSLLPPYRKNASWLFNDAVIKYIRKIKTGIASDTTYIWQPSVVVGQPDSILGKPVYADPDMNGTMTTGLITGLFGDFSYYWIRDATGVAFQRLNELYAASGQVGFRAYMRTDGKLLNTAAVKKLTQA